MAFRPFFYDIFQAIEDEYLEGWLTDSLIVGHKYKLSFYYCSGGKIALDLKILDAYFGNEGWFNMDKRRDLPYPTITFNLINNRVWNKAEGTFVAQNTANQIALGIFKHDNMTYEDLYIKYLKKQAKEQETTLGNILIKPQVKSLSPNLKAISF